VVRIEGSFDRNLFEFVADSKEVFPLFRAQFWQERPEVRYLGSFGVMVWNANWEIETGEDASGISGFCSKVRKKIGKFAYWFGL
jgi:hypothetical protein